MQGGSWGIVSDVCSGKRGLRCAICRFQPIKRAAEVNLCDLFPTFVKRFALGKGMCRMTESCEP